MEAEKQRVFYADVLRVLAAFAVVVLHVAGDGWKNTAVGSMDWHIYNLYGSLVRWAVPIFVMLSGMFLLDPGKELDTGKIYRKYILRVLIAIVVWGLFYRCTDIAISRYIRHKDISRNAAIVELLEIPFGTAWFHLWYLYMIVGLYVMTPIYRVFTRTASQKECRYLLAVFALFGICLPLLKKGLICIHPRLELNLTVAETVNYTGYFFAGYCFSKASLSKRQKGIVYAVGILSFFIMAVGTAFLSIRGGENTEVLYENLSPVTMLETVMVFILVKSLCGRTSTGRPSATNTTRLISNISSCTFGIYLLHAFVLRVYIMAGVTKLFFSPWLSVPLVSLLIFSVSLSITYLLRKIPVCRWFM
ncbi:MAG: acyltransferase family protein [Treponema sp.]|nr:acyltransferase family protein [Treponema sp.]